MKMEFVRENLAEVHQHDSFHLGDLSSFFSSHYLDDNVHKILLSKDVTAADGFVQELWKDSLGRDSMSSHIVVKNTSTYRTVNIEIQAIQLT